MLPDEGLKIWTLVWFIVKSECAWASMMQGMSDARSHLWHDHVVQSGMVHYGRFCYSTVKAGKWRLKKLLGPNCEAQTEWLYLWILRRTIVFTTDLRTNGFMNDWCIERDHLQNVFYKHFRHYMRRFTQAWFYKQLVNYLQQFT